MEKIRYQYDKVIRYGQYLDIYKYERPTLRGYSNKKTNNAHSDRLLEEEKRSDNIFRARTKIRRIVNANPQLNKFLTLTFADKENIDLHRDRDLIFEYVADPAKLDVCNYHFKKFKQRLNYKLGNKLQYIVIPEFQKNGNVHYHMLATLPYFRAADLAATWRGGFAKINRIDNITNVGAYVCKYLTKQQATDNLVNKKSFFYSTSLNQPVEVQLSELGDLRLSKEKVYDYNSEYNGKVHMEICKILN